MKIVMLVIGEIVQVKLAGDASFPKDVGSGGALQPSHNGQVVALQAMGPLLISGAQDGTMRIWDMRSPSTKDRMLLPPRDGPRCLYGLGVCACMRERKRRRIVCAPPLAKNCMCATPREELYVPHPSGPNPRGQRSGHPMAAPPQAWRRGCRSAGIRATEEAGAEGTWVQRSE
jgi:hypothetical protein